MEQKDIRWKQRLNNLKLAYGQLGEAIALAKQRDLSLLEQQGLIKAFEFTYELSWNLMKDYFYFQGGSAITGSRDAFREAFKTGLIDDGDLWMEMIQSRNRTSHTYNQELARQISQRILQAYFFAFESFIKTMENLKK